MNNRILRIRIRTNPNHQLVTAVHYNDGSVFSYFIDERGNYDTYHTGPNTPSQQETYVNARDLNFRINTI